MCDVNESRPIWVSHVPYEWVMSHMNESCPIATWLVVSLVSLPVMGHDSYMSHVPYEWVMSHKKRRYGTWGMTCSYVWHDSFTCHVTRVETSRHTCEWVMSHIWMDPDMPQTEKIGFKIITTANISTNFHESPRNFQTSLHGSPQIFKQGFTEENGSRLIAQWNRIIWKSKYYLSLISSVSGDIWVTSHNRSCYGTRLIHKSYPICMICGL